MWEPFLTLKWWLNKLDLLLEIYWELPPSTTFLHWKICLTESKRFKQHHFNWGFFNGKTYNASPEDHQKYVFDIYKDIGSACA